MTPLDIGSALAAEHTHDLRRAACASRLVALVRCCQPTVWARTAGRAAAVVSRLHAALRRSQLGPVNNYCTCP